MTQLPDLWQRGHRPGKIFIGSYCFLDGKSESGYNNRVADRGDRAAMDW